MSDIIPAMSGDRTGYDFLAGKGEGYKRAWGEAVETITRAFSAATDVDAKRDGDAAHLN